jgi:hypothetical protein
MSGLVPGPAPEPVPTVDPEAASPAPQAARRGMQAVTGETFSFTEAVGGVRGVVEALVPGTLFITVYVISHDLGWSLGSAVAAAVVALVARLVQRTPVTQALGGLLGIGVGVVWAWRSGEAQNFFAWGLWTNAIYLVVVLVSILVRWPAVGLFVEAVRAGFATAPVRPQPGPDASATTEPDPGTENGPGLGAEGGAGDGPSLAALVAWRKDRLLLRRYTAATWLWVGMFGLRLAVQVPLFLDESIGWLGTARRVLGVPLWGLVLYLTWMVVREVHDDGGEVQGDGTAAGAGTPG